MFRFLIDGIRWFFATWKTIWNMEKVDNKADPEVLEKRYALVSLVSAKDKKENG